MFQLLRFFLLLWFGILLAASVAAQTPALMETPLFVSGQGGYHTYRIPAIIQTTNGTLLAFCEARKNSAADTGDIDLVLRRSTNQGLSWEPMTVVQEEGSSNNNITIGNPVPVVDETTGKIHLLFCRNSGRVFHTVSTNDGLSWSSRTEITSTVKLAGWGFYATGPGHGIQLRRGAQAGRLIVPSDHAIGPDDGTPTGTFGAQVIYSDDHGATWQLGAIQDTTNNVAPNENLAVEMVAPAVNGGSRIYFNSREHGSAAGTRAQLWSTNGGLTYAGLPTNNTFFVCPTVQGSVQRIRATDAGDARNRILFSCANHASSRVNLSIWSSTNEALGWSASKSIYSGASAYSDLVRMTNGNIGLLYEKGVSSPYETVTFAQFNEAWLDAPSPPEESPVPAFWNFEEKIPGQNCTTNVGGLLDISPANFTNHLTAQAAFAYVAGSTNFGGGAALHFDGTGGLQLTDAASANHFDFSATNSFSIEAVFRVASNYVSVGALVAKDYGSQLPSWWLRLASGKIQFIIVDNNGIESLANCTNFPVNDGNWHHVVAVRDATNPANKRQLVYVDSVLVTNIADATTGSLANAQPFNIGRFGANATRNLIGDIDMVRLTPAAFAPSHFLKRDTQFDADGDFLPDSFERSLTNSLQILGAGNADGDGQSDVIEFALGSNPLLASSQPETTVLPGATNVTVIATPRALPLWLALELQSSTNLQTWLTRGEPATLTPLTNNFFQRAQTLTYPAGIPAAQFFRYRVLMLP
jgi:sialidase-1